MDLTKIRDEKGLSLLHIASQQESAKAAKLLCEHVQFYGNGCQDQTFRDKKKYLKAWINEKTACEHQFTALHYASYTGNHFLA